MREGGEMREGEEVERGADFHCMITGDTNIDDVHV